VGTVVPSGVTREGLAEMMVGHELPSQAPPAGTVAELPRLIVRDLRVKGDRGVDAVRGAGFEVRGGEIVGIAGVSGNGQRELTEAIAGLRPVAGGSIDVEGTELVGRRPAEVRRAGVGYVPEERMRDAVVPAFSVAENLILIDNATPAFSRWGFLRGRAIRRHSDELVAEFNVKTPGLDTPARNLSGGNIQKLILARELSARPRLLLAAQPTRGVDVGAARYVHDRLMEQRAAGTAILVVSEDLDEVLSLADRVLVMYEGEIIAEARPRESTREALGLMMAGLRGDVRRPIVQP
jgi:simple sugar transport system ATP-binding protein